jgi:hypothetical protein
MRAARAGSSSITALSPRESERGDRTDGQWVGTPIILVSAAFLGPVTTALSNGRGVVPVT